MAEKEKKVRIVRADVCQFCENWEYCEEHGIECEALKRLTHTGNIPNTSSAVPGTEVKEGAHGERISKTRPIR